MTATPTLLITSAAYCDAEMQAELGHLPPSFLPIRNRRLYELQVEEMAHLKRQVVLTLPESFGVPDHDAAALQQLGVSILPVPDGLRLGESVIYALNLLSLGRSPVAILHGDTLISGIPASELDVISVARSDDAYRWAVAATTAGGTIDLAAATGDASAEGGSVLSGYFAFSDASLLVKSLTRAHGGFVEGLRLYSGERDLRPIACGPWHDFGHLQTYYRSRRAMTTPRAFNGLSMDRYSASKSSTAADKMEAEAAWFEEIPPALRVFAPTYLGRTEVHGNPGYRLETVYCLPLNDLFVFGSQSESVWRRIFASCAEFMDECEHHKPPNASALDLDHLYLPKTLERLERYGRATGFDPDKPIAVNGRALPSPTRMAEMSAELIPPPTPEMVGVMHGDLCLSNVLYDHRSQRITVVDPRGYVVPGQPTCFGDLRYDLAKLNHSVVGRYDLILAGRFSVSMSAQHDFELTIQVVPSTAIVEDAFRAHTYAGLRPDDPAITAITVHLFLSMLPLHAEDPVRQRAFIANAGRVFSLLDSAKGS